MENYRIKKITRLTKEYSHQWSNLWNSAPGAHFFNSLEHFISFIDVFPATKYMIVFCYKKDELVAILPLVWGYRFGIKTLLCIDSFGDSIDRSSLCIKKQDPEILRFLIESATEKKNNIFLAELEEKHLNLFMRNNMSIIKNCTFEFSCKSLRINFEKDLLASMSKKTRKKFKKKIKKSEDSMTFEFHRKENAGDFQKMIEIEQKSWKSKKGIAIFQKDSARNIYRSWIKNNNKNVGVAFLKKDNKEIACLFGMFANKTFLITNIAFVSEFSKFTPGKILIFYVLRYLQKNGFNTVDFSVGDSKWKRDFSNQILKQYDFYFSKNLSVCIWWKSLLFIKGIIKRITKLGNCPNG